MAAAGLAPLPIAPLVRVVLADLVFPLGHLDRLRLPECERVDRAGGPAPTGGAMAVAGALRVARDLDRDSAAVALPLVGLLILIHEFSLRSSARRTAIERLQRSGAQTRREILGIRRDRASVAVVGWAPIAPTSAALRPRGPSPFPVSPVRDPHETPPAGA